MCSSLAVGKRRQFAPEQVQGIIKACIAHAGKLPGKDHKDGIPPDYALVSKHLISSDTGRSVFKRATRQSVRNTWLKVCKWVKKHPGVPWEESIEDKGEKKGRKQTFDEPFVKALFHELEKYACNSHLGEAYMLANTSVFALGFCVPILR